MRQQGFLSEGKNTQVTSPTGPREARVISSITGLSLSYLVMESVSKPGACAMNKQNCGSNQALRAWVQVR